MRLSVSDNFKTNNLIDLKNNDWLDKQRVAGQIVARTLSMLKQQVDSGTTSSLLELNAIAEEFITTSGATPTFKGYKGFPAGVCISVNNELVHGIPKDYKLSQGDVVSFDLGATVEGAIADSALTCIFGEPKSHLHSELVVSTAESLYKGIKSIQVGKRLGVIGYAISKYAKNKGFGLITKYGGHGLSWNTPHAAPFVDNKSDPDHGIRIAPGLSIAIEPMLVIGSPETRTLDDGWTVVTPSIGAHFEHSVFVHEDHVEVLTWREDDLFIKNKKLYFSESNL